VGRITEEEFAGKPPLVIATGGFAQLFNRDKLFDEEVPDLILKGLQEIVQLNR
jgi:type III pantothenate kinase